MRFAGAERMVEPDAEQNASGRTVATVRRRHGAVVGREPMDPPVGRLEEVAHHPQPDQVALLAGAGGEGEGAGGLGGDPVAADAVASSRCVWYVTKCSS